MDEAIRQWLVDMYTKEVDEAKGAILNERVWGLGYDEEKPNPHTENIARLNAYIGILEDKINEIS